MPIWGMVLSALAEIRVGKVRVILSAFCVACLVATVTLVTALSGLTQQAMQKSFEKQSGRPGTLEMYVEFGYGPQGPTPPSAAALEKIRKTMERYRVTYSALSRVGQAQIRTKDRRVFKSQRSGPPHFDMVGSDHGLGDICTIEVVAGRWLSPMDDQRFEPSLVVNKDFARKLGFTPAQAIGAEVELAISGQWLKSRIVGVVAGKGNQVGPHTWAGQVFLPYTAMTRWGMPVEGTQYMLRVPPADVKRISAQLQRDSKDWGATAHVNEISGNFGAISSKLKWLMLGAAVAILLLGALPVLVLGIFAVRQRRSEFGVHRCFGATGSDLFLTVLLEALIVCTSAGLAGVGLAYVVQERATRVVLSRRGLAGIEIDTSFPWEAAQLGLGTAVCVGVFTGLIPAMRAMQRSVIRAIRA